ncbi:MAG: response regulator [Pseudomonadota bacterium]
MKAGLLHSPDDTGEAERGIGVCLAHAGSAYVVDDLEADRLVASRFAIDAGYKVRTFTSGSNLIAELPRLEPGLFIVDVMMPDVDGAAVLDAVLARDLGDMVIMMSAHGDVSTAIGTMRRGAHDFLLKPVGGAESAAVLARAAASFQQERARTDADASTREMLHAITPKEMVVLRKLLAGKRNKNIAFELGVSERTVEVHRSRLIKRTDTATFAGLIAFAVRAGIEPDTD